MGALCAAGVKMTHAIRPYQRNKRVCLKAACLIRDAAAIVAVVEIPGFRFHRNIRSRAELSQHDFSKWRTQMKLVLAAIATAALIGTAFPACAEEVGVGVGVGPVGVTVGAGHRDRDVVREREVIRDRDDRRDRDTVIIKRGDRDRDIDHDRRKVIIDRD
jgi:hypothetical protein